MNSHTIVSGDDIAYIYWRIDARLARLYKRRDDTRFVLTRRLRNKIMRKVTNQYLRVLCA